MRSNKLLQGYAAMGQQQFHVEGLEDLDIALQELPKATAKNVLKRAFITAIEPVIRDAKAFAPFKSGALSRSIAISTTLSKRQRSLYVQESNFEMFAGASALPHAHLQEFGTVKMPAHPFLRPAWDANKIGVLESIKKSLADEIEKARARLARKAEREAARMNS